MKRRSFIGSLLVWIRYYNYLKTQFHVQSCVVALAINCKINFSSPVVVGSKRLLESPEGTPEAKRARPDRPVVAARSPTTKHLLQDMGYMYKTLLQSFQYLKVQELLRASRVSHLWRDIALHNSLVSLFKRLCFSVKSN